MATRDPDATPLPVPAHSLPTASPTERQAASQTWLYLAAFQSHNVSVVDPLSGHALHEFATKGDQAGMAAAPDGTRLYILDDEQGGELRVYRAGTWDVIHREKVEHYARLLGDSPMMLSGDGQWLVVAHLDFNTRQSWTSVFDARRMQFQPHTVPVRSCREGWLPIRLLGLPNHPRVYADCQGFIQALDAETLMPLWHAAAPTAVKPALELSPDGMRIYGVYPRVNDLRVQVWQSAEGKLLTEQMLGDRLTIPPATFGRGDAVYATLSPDGARLFIACGRSTRIPYVPAANCACPRPPAPWQRA